MFLHDLCKNSWYNKKQILSRNNYFPCDCSYGILISLAMFVPKVRRRKLDFLGFSKPHTQRKTECWQMLLSQPQQSFFPSDKAMVGKGGIVMKVTTNPTLPGRNQCLWWSQYFQDYLLLWSSFQQHKVVDERIMYHSWKVI